jgi:hypothetical protein
MWRRKAASAAAATAPGAVLAATATGVGDGAGAHRREWGGTGHVERKEAMCLCECWAVRCSRSFGNLLFTRFTASLGQGLEGVRGGEGGHRYKWSSFDAATVS